MDWSWWTVLYIAFGVVALWLLGEVLLQYKARLRWRLLAFFGFLGVVVGFVLSSRALIIAGALAFGAGQALVTLSFLRGFSTGWALGGKPGASRRRRTVRKEGREQAPSPEAAEQRYDAAEPPYDAAEQRYDAAEPPYDAAEQRYDAAEPPYDADEQRYEEPQAPPMPGTPPVHEPLPLPDDTGGYAAYGTGGAEHPAGTAPSAPRDAYGDYPAYDPAAYDPAAYAPVHEPAADPGHQYAAYADPYTDPYGGREYGGHEPYGQQPYGQQPHPADPYPAAPYPADPYAQQYAADTPPGGVWVPPQRDGEPQFPPPPQQPPAAHGHDQSGRAPY
ncbi:hypothetical protein [Streptomyces fradiae]|uniref:hypothetical protein n=1 Tax=Streptomyces fradiae TaxID=1906 RepID=UPI0035BE79E7